MADATLIAIVGAESTGKTTLACALAARLTATTSRRVAWVPELLREWCERMGRTPQAQEQAPLMRAQHERIQAAADTHDIVVCDTTALMTAVYSRLIFGDRSLEARAAELHRGVAATLLTALDIAWVADGLQRDGPQVREPVDQALRELMRTHRLPFAVVGGQGDARVEQALAAAGPVLKPRESAGRGLFTRLGEARAPRRGWACECCDPSAERSLLRAR